MFDSFVVILLLLSLFSLNVCDYNTCSMSVSPPSVPSLRCWFMWIEMAALHIYHYSIPSHCKYNTTTEERGWLGLVASNPKSISNKTK